MFRARTICDPRGGIGRACAAVLLLACPVGQSCAESLTYVLTPQFEQGVLKVEITWETGERTQSALRIAERWGQVENVPALLSEVTFSSGARRDGGVWVVSHRRRETIQCSYVVDPRRRAFDDWNRSYYPITTPDFFHGVGNAFLLVPYPAAGGPAEYETVLRWRLPAGMEAVCSWGAGRTVGARLAPSSLSHSSYLAGRLAVRSAQAGARTVTAALVERFSFSPEDFLAQTMRIIDTQVAFMGEAQFPDFVVTVIPVGPDLRAGESRIAGSGLFNSFVLYLAPRSRINDALQHLFAHELFHYWNGRILEPESPERLVYWFTEGLTDYYALRILYESGVWSAATYVKWVNRHLRDYALNPAARARNADIERDYWKLRDTVGEAPYQRGLALGLRWHRLARDQGVADGLDRLFRALVARGRTGFKLTNMAIRAAGVRELGAWWGPEFDRYVEQAELVDVPPRALAPGIEGVASDVFEYQLGFDRTRSLPERRVRGLIAGSAAEKAGVREGDELLEWDIPADADQQVRLTVRRTGSTHKIRYLPRGESRRAMQFRVQ